MKPTPDPTRASILAYLRRVSSAPGFGSNPYGALYRLGYRAATEGVIAAIEAEADIRPPVEATTGTRSYTDRASGAMALALSLAPGATWKRENVPDVDAVYLSPGGGSDLRIERCRNGVVHVSVMLGWCPMRWGNVPSLPWAWAPRRDGKPPPAWTLLLGRLRDRAAYSGSYEASVRKAEAARALLAMLETKEVKGA